MKGDDDDTIARRIIPRVLELAERANRGNCTSSEVRELGALAAWVCGYAESKNRDKDTSKTNTDRRRAAAAN